MIARPTILAELRTALERSRVVILTGPRRCGKTTIARQLLDPDALNYFDLEDPASLERLDEPMTALQPLKGLVVIDEVQRRPELFPVLRVLADRAPQPTRFLILSSASGALQRQHSQSLTGRTEHLRIGGFSLAELGAASATDLWRRGTLPPSHLANSEHDSLNWRAEFMQTFLERDLPQWGVWAPARALRRFLILLAHHHGQSWNAAKLAREIGLSETTTRRYLNLLSDALIIRQLLPWHANISKRQVKSPRIYIRDSGLLHLLLGIKTQKALQEHPKQAESWQGFVIEQVLNTQKHHQAHFWSTHQGATIPLILHRNNNLFGIQCQYTNTPHLSPSIHHALKDLQLKQIAIIHPGHKQYLLTNRVEAIPLAALTTPNSLFLAHA